MNIPAQVIEIRNAWARASVVAEGAAYLELISPAADALTGITSPDAGMAMLHQSVSSGGVESMGDLDRVVLPAGVLVRLAPRGTHVMLMDLRHRLVAGQSLTLRLSFAHSAAMTVVVPILPAGASGPAR